MLNPEHLAALQRALPRHYSIELTGPVPYLPGLRVPYYLFVGRKPGRVRAVHTFGSGRAPSPSGASMSALRLATSASNKR